MPKNTFDPRLTLPPVVDAEYENKDTAGVITYQTDMPEFLIPPTYRLRPPEHVVLVEQIVRQAPGGKDVVDLIFEVEDVPGASEYEVRVTNQ